MAFAAKEAALEWLGVGMAVPLASVRLAPEGERCPAAAAWRGWALLEHGGGRARLPMAAWELLEGRLCVLLGG